MSGRKNSHHFRGRFSEELRGCASLPGSAGGNRKPPEISLSSCKKEKEMQAEDP